MARSKAQYLKEIKEGSHVLIIGGGTGEILTYLMHASVTFIDSSESMIEIAKLKGYQNVEFRCTSWEDFESVATYDCIIAFYFFDMFTESDLKKLLLKVNSKLKMQGSLLVTDFVNNKRWHTLFLRVLYLFFRAATRLKTNKLPDWELNTKVDFSLRESTSHYAGFIKSCWFTKKLKGEINEHPVQEDALPSI